MLAAAVRLLGIGNTDLWGDEAFSVMTAVGPIRNLVAALATGEPHPPLYPLLLAGWLRLFGRAEAVARLPSAFFGIGSVAVATAIGRHFAPPHDRSGADRAALIAGLLVAINPIQVWYSQEARMYEQMSFFAGVATLLLLRVTSKSRAGILAYALAVVATAGSHYYGLFVPLAHGIAVVSRGRSGASLFRSWLVGSFLAGLLYVPWVYLARSIFFGYYAAQPGTVDLPAIALSAWVRLGSAWSLSWPVASVAAIAFSCFVLAGAIVPARSESDRLLRTTMICWVVIPFVVGYLVSLFRPMYAERYLVVSSLPVVLLVARAIAAAFQLRPVGSVPGNFSTMASSPSMVGIVAGLGSLALVAGLAAGPLYNVWIGRYVKSTYNTHVRDVEALIRPNDAIILDGTSQLPLYHYYVHQPWAMFPLPRDVPLNLSRTTAELQDISAKHTGAWIFLYATTDYDPNYRVARWLTQHAYRGFDDWAVTGRLQYYRFDDPANLPVTGSAIAFGNQLQLVRFGEDLRNAAAGDSAPLALYWQRPNTNGPRLRISLRLVDQSGFTWAQSDQEVGGDFFDEGDWPAGATLEDHHALQIPPGTPPGSYRMLLNTYRADNGEPLPPAGTGAPIEIGGVALGSLIVTGASDHVWTPGIAGFRHSNHTFGDSLELVGYAQSSTVVAGDSGYLTMVWRSLKPRPVYTAIDLDLIDPNGVVAQTREVPLATAGYPSDAWQASDVLREQYHLALRVGLPPGTYGLAVRPTGPGVDVGSRASVKLGHIVVTGTTGSSAPPTPTIPLSYSLGQGVAFDGFDLSTRTVRSGDRIHLVLHWRDLAQMATDYTVFVHVLDSSQKVVAQRDSPPDSGSRPTSAWFSGDVIVDRYDLDLPSKLAPGTYDLEIGMYNPANGTRLPVAKDGQPAGDRVIVSQLEVSP